jgi:hypothetical protein
MMDIGRNDGNLLKTAIVLIALLISGPTTISCGSDSAEWIKQDDWAQSGPVCYSTPKDWSNNLPAPGSAWSTFMSRNGGLGMLSRTDPTGSAELTIARLQPRGNGSAGLGTFAEWAADALMADYAYLDSWSMSKTEVSGYPAYEIEYRGSNDGADIEGRFAAIEGGAAVVIITYVALAKEWEHFGQLYDRTKSNIRFATKQDADGNWEVCFPWYR